MECNRSGWAKQCNYWGKKKSCFQEFSAKSFLNLESERLLCVSLQSRNISVVQWLSWWLLGSAFLEHLLKCEWDTLTVWKENKNRANQKRTISINIFSYEFFPPLLFLADFWSPWPCNWCSLHCEGFRLPPALFTFQKIWGTFHSLLIHSSSFILWN